MNMKKTPISSILALLFSTMLPTISKMREFSPDGASCAPHGGKTTNQPHHACSCAQRGAVDVVVLGHGRLGRHDHDLHVVHGGQEHHVDQVDT